MDYVWITARGRLVALASLLNPRGEQAGAADRVHFVFGGPGGTGDGFACGTTGWVVTP